VSCDYPYIVKDVGEKVSITPILLTDGNKITDPKTIGDWIININADYGRELGVIRWKSSHEQDDNRKNKNALNGHFIIIPWLKKYSDGLRIRIKKKKSRKYPKIIQQLMKPKNMRLSFCWS
jgi:hypothetical protein